MVFNLNIHPGMIDANLLHNYAQIDQGGLGVQAAARAQILASPQLKQNADDPRTGFLFFAYLNTKVKPLDNVHCRRAVEYAADKTAFQTAFGGPIAGGDIASTVLPPTLTGHKKFDFYEATTRPHGDLANARQQLAACGQPNGFTTTLAYAADDPRQTAAATAEQQALARAGITLALRGYSTGTFYDLVGTPAYVHQRGIGLALGGWAADWPDGFGFLYNLTAGPAIRTAGTLTSKNSTTRW
jgi:peptide/nickel transport system substrate-binding protein